MSENYEKLGAFYLGRGYDRVRNETTPEPLLYDAKDLTTHGVIVGMTGSGKTGLSIGLLEEAAIDGVPALVIDPKGDLANLMLTFPNLEPADFLPWIDPAEAARKGRTSAEHAAATAELWKNGLAEWDQDGARIQRFRDAAEVTIYTPGSNAGLPINVLRSFGAPSEAVRADRDALLERIEGSVSGLLAMIGIEADPVQSREHILLSNLLYRAWGEGRDLDLGSLIAGIQKPPFEKLGVIDLETFYPTKERVGLAMSINSLLASPGFGAWLEGEPLDVGRLLYRADGRPRISVVSIAHLSDSERMFIVTLLLNETVSWIRSQPGTSSLRALLYMDEIFGFFPPTAAPPSKKPMLTLLKQARAYGLGVVLATQNPVDLDYKGLSNCGTWFIGRLQTERDKERVLAGLEGASSQAGQTLDRQELAEILGNLGQRVFLMNNVHEDAPTLFQTRWAMSYLRGPMVRREIETLMAEQKAAGAIAEGPVPPAPTAVPAQPAASATSTTEAKAAAKSQADSARPVIPPDIDETFLPPREQPAAGSLLIYRPQILGLAQLHFKRLSAGVDDWRSVHALSPIDPKARTLSWDKAVVREGEGPQTVEQPADAARFAHMPAFATRAKSFATGKKKLASALYKTQQLTLFSYRPFKLQSKLGESEGDFRQRVALALTEARDLGIEKLRAKHASTIESLEKRIRAAEDRVERERSQHRDRKLQTAVSFGTSLLGALMGRKKLSVTNLGRAGRAMRDVGRSQREKDDVERATESHEELLRKKAELEQELEKELDELRTQAPSSAQIELEKVEIRPLKGDIAIERCALVWTPWSLSSSGIAEPLFDLG